MPPEPVPADPGWDDDPAWSRPDPMTAEELEASLDRLCELDEGPGEEEYADFAPLTAQELAEISRGRRRRAAGGEGGHHRPAGPGPARLRRGSSRASRPARRPGSARGCRWTCCPAARAWRSPPTPPRKMTASPGSPRPSWSESCAPGTGSRPTPPPASWPSIAELARRNPSPEDAEFTADEIANALGESRTRAYELLDTAERLQTRLPGTEAALLDGTLSLGKAR